MEQTDVQNEQIKLRATFINGLAIGIMLIGVFTPITRAAYDPVVAGDAFFFWLVRPQFVSHSASSYIIMQQDI